MVEVKKYYLSPTSLMPNSPYPLLHYPRLLADKAECDAAKIQDLFSGNGWQIQWIWRYGPTQTSHYHSKTHECMAVLSGSATIRFGVADTSSDLDASTHGSAKEDGGVELHAEAGDVFIIPAGMAHKTFDTVPSAELKLLTPGDGHRIDAEDVNQALKDIEISGFTMMGAYPQHGVWDFAVGGDHSGEFEKVWSVPKPENDPVLGPSESGLCGLWK
ncbi:hypothetical protein CLAIMM_08289 [Cladophialophora immunda]|nr:hypothetical protein CLAIMM_08289 [Cladophialophora immunda]